ncbi:MAG: hydantoinase B/oxoprolinase family protein, partial [Anaerolineae bacterium]|nr:hydantoinase B/oxoprolinase family protein [Anaerolineae bacterium]
VRRVYEFLTPATVTINSERRIYAPYGLDGGEAGEVGVNTVAEEQVSGKWTGQVQTGDKVVIETPGGGGWGVSATG